jgi:hypothetical protein
MSFERVEFFKYLAVGLDTTSDGHNEVQRRITAANRCFGMLRPLFKSGTHSKKLKITIFFCLPQNQVSIGNLGTYLIFFLILYFKYIII